MTWIVDTCVVIDVFENDPDFGLRSARLLEERLGEGLAISPIANLLIGAFASNRSGLITRNPADFRKNFPELTILVP